MSTQLPTVAPGTVSAIMAASRQVADVLCDKWTLLILLGAQAGDSRFSEFRDRWGISNRMLTVRLEALETQELLVKMLYSRRPERYSYHLTPKGTALFDIFACMISWETAGSESAARLVRIEHLTCSHRASQPSTHCAACNEPVLASNVGFTIHSEAPPQLPQWTTAYRRSAPRGAEASTDQGTPLEKVLAIYGNRWSNEIIRCAFLRVSTFGEIQRYTGISTNILADRLARLVEAGVLRQESCVSDGRSINYKLTARGRQLFSIVLAMWDWADQWIDNRVHAPLRMTHRDCGKALRISLRCDQCAGLLKPSNAKIVLATPDVGH